MPVSICNENFWSSGERRKCRMGWGKHRTCLANSMEQHEHSCRFRRDLTRVRGVLKRTRAFATQKPYQRDTSHCEMLSAKTRPFAPETRSKTLPPPCSLKPADK